MLPAWLLVGAVSSTVFLLATPAGAQDPGAPDVVYYNGKVVTVDDAFGIAEAVAISGGRIVAVGSDEEVAVWRRVRRAKSISVAGRCCLASTTTTFTWASEERRVPVELTIIDGKEVFSGSHVEPYFQESPRSR